MTDRRECDVEGCDRVHSARGLCRAHYMKAWKRDTLPPRVIRTPAERLDEHTERMPDGCWLWRGGLQTNGYGQLKIAGRVWASHRLAWTLANDRPIPAGMHVCHRCDVPLCINPAHLFLGTPSDNARDMVAKGRANNWQAAKTHCKRGHELSGDNVYRPPGGRPARCCRACQRLRERAARRAVAS